MRTLTICGSMRYEKEMREISFLLEVKHRFNVLQCIYDLQPNMLSSTNKVILEEAQLKRIDLSDAIYVMDIDELHFFFSLARVNTPYEHPSKLAEHPASPFEHLFWQA